MPRRHALAAIAALACCDSGGMARAAECQDPAPWRHEAIWAVAMAVPDGPGRDFRILDLRARHPADAGGGTGLVLCGRLAFAEADAGIVHVAVPYARDARGVLRPGTPFFHGETWLRGTASLADLCAGEGMAWRP